MFRRKLHWAWVHRASQQEAYEAPLVKRDPLPCNIIVDAAVKNFGMAVQRLVVDSVREANTKLRKNLSTSPAYIAFALKWLRSSKVKAVLSDKDGTFVCINEQTLNWMWRQQITSGCYTPKSTLALEVVHREILSTNLSLAKRLEGIGFVQWAAEVG